LATAAVDDFPTISRFHPFPETVVLFSVDFARLVGSFHFGQPLTNKNVQILADNEVS